MRSLTTCVAAGLLSLLLLPGTAAAPDEPARIGWSDLRPADRGDELAWNDADRMIELSGYLLPVDRDDDLIYEFLLVPWAGACSHAAQPPANQVVLVIPETPYRAEKSYQQVSIAGSLKPGRERTQLFIMDGVAVVESGYSVGRAVVTASTEQSDTAARPGRVPWRFLRE